MPNQNAEVIILGNRTVGMVHDRLFGQFLELTGRCINGGLYDPDSPLARADGLRADVVEALRELRPGYVRYPGGCAVAYFDWQELVGPRDQRPRAKLYRNSGGQPQATAFGIPEAYAFCREIGAELYLTVNANTQSPEDAAHLVEYLNSNMPTRYADMRRAHGRESPYGVKWFGLGNEIYGNWQPGQKTAEEYVAWCAEAIRQMKWIDPTIKVVVCGFGRPNPEWDRTVLFRLIGLADLISVHNYFGRPIFADLMAASRICEQMLSATNHIIDEAMDIALGVHPRAAFDFGAVLSPSQRPGIALDEWNLWYRAAHDPHHDVEEIYNYSDALAAASLLHVILRHATTVQLANISLAVNTLGSIRTDRNRMVRQTTWYAQKLIRDVHTGRIVEAVTDAPLFSAKHERFFCGVVDVEKARDDKLPTLQHFDDIPALDVLVSIEDARKKLSITLIQKLPDRPLTVRLDLHGIAVKGEKMMVSRLTGGKDLLAENTLDAPDRVGIQSGRENLTTTFTLPPASLTALAMDLR
jgi:alpha-N-arabinofuranosidase